MLRRSAFVIAVSVWALAVGFGLSVLWAYEHAPGTPADAPGRWPAASRLPPPHARPTLVQLLHPQCTCSHATIAELARLMARVQGRVDAHVLIVAPAGTGESFAKSDLW